MCQVSCFFFGNKKRDSGRQWKKCSGIQDFRRSGIAGTKHPFQTPVVDDSRKLHAFVVGRTVTLFRLNNTKKWSNEVVIMESIRTVPCRLGNRLSKTKNHGIRDGV